MLSLSTRLASLPAFELSDCNAFSDSRMFRFAWGEHFSAYHLQMEAFLLLTVPAHILFIDFHLRSSYPHAFLQLPLVTRCYVKSLPLFP